MRGIPACEGVPGFVGRLSFILIMGGLSNFAAWEVFTTDPPNRLVMSGPGGFIVLSKTVATYRRLLLFLSTA
jgi:hypothetical protein